MNISAQQPESARLTLGLCVIAKNAEETIQECMASVAGLVDAVVLVDTGSTDQTVNRARGAGATVVFHPWSGSFAEARNAALEATSTDWVLVLDADEELDAGAHDWIRAELAAPSADGYTVPVRNYLQPWEEPDVNFLEVPPGEQHPRAPEARLYFKSEVCRLYRRSPEIAYEGTIHEQVEYKMLRQGLRIGRAGFFIHHFGWYLIDDANLKRKRVLYCDLLAAKTRERPEDAQVWMQYGDALCAWFEKWEEGLQCFLCAAKLEPGNGDNWALVAQALLRVGLPEQALLATEQIRTAGPNTAKRAQVRSQALIELQRWTDAREECREAARQYPGYLTIELSLAKLEIICGNSAAGERRMQELLQQAAAEARTYGRALTYRRAAELYAQHGFWLEALAMLEQAAILFPADTETHRLRLKAAVAVNQLDRAAEAAAAICELCPSPSAILRLSAILCHSGKTELAKSVVDDGLRVFPLSNELQQAHREFGLPGLHASSEGFPDQVYAAAADAS